MAATKYGLYNFIVGRYHTKFNLVSISLIALTKDFIFGPSSIVLLFPEHPVCTDLILIQNGRHQSLDFFKGEQAPQVPLPFYYNHETGTCYPGYADSSIHYRKMAFMYKIWIF
jgi:hypothetical protein